METNKILDRSNSNMRENFIYKSNEKKTIDNENSNKNNESKLSIPLIKNLLFTKYKILLTNIFSAKSTEVEFFRRYISSEEFIFITEFQSDINKKCMNEFIIIKYKSIREFKVNIVGVIVIDNSTKKVIDVIIYICKTENQINSGLYLTSSQLNIKLPSIKIENPLFKLLTKFNTKVFGENLYIFWNVSNYFLIYKINLKTFKSEKVYQKEFHPGTYLIITDPQYQSSDEDEYKIFINTKPGNKFMELSRVINQGLEIYNLIDRNYDLIIKSNSSAFTDINWSEFRIKRFIQHKNLFFLEAQKNTIFSIKFKKSKLKAFTNIENYRAKFFLPFHSIKTMTYNFILDELQDNRTLIIKNHRTSEKENSVECEKIQTISIECDQSLPQIGEYEFFLLDNENFLVIFYELEIILLFNLQEAKQGKNMFLIENIFELIFENFNGVFFDFDLLKNPNTYIPEMLIINVIYEGSFKRYEINLDNCMKLKKIIKPNAPITKNNCQTELIMEEQDKDFNLNINSAKFSIKKEENFDNKNEIYDQVNNFCRGSFKIEKNIPTNFSAGLTNYKQKENYDINKHVTNFKSAQNDKAKEKNRNLNNNSEDFIEECTNQFNKNNEKKQKKLVSSEKSNEKKDEMKSDNKSRFEEMMEGDISDKTNENYLNNSIDNGNNNENYSDGNSEGKKQEFSEDNENDENKIKEIPNNKDELVKLNEFRENFFNSITNDLKVGLDIIIDKKLEEFSEKISVKLEKTFNFIATQKQNFTEIKNKNDDLMKNILNLTSLTLQNRQILANNFQMINKMNQNSNNLNMTLVNSTQIQNNIPIRQTVNRNNLINQQIMQNIQNVQMNAIPQRQIYGKGIISTNINGLQGNSNGGIKQMITNTNLIPNLQNWESNRNLLSNQNLTDCNQEKIKSEMEINKNTEEQKYFFQNEDFDNFGRKEIDLNENKKNNIDELNLSAIEKDKESDTDQLKNNQTN